MSNKYPGSDGLEELAEKVSNMPGNGYNYGGGDVDINEINNALDEVNETYQQAVNSSRNCALEIENLKVSSRLDSLTNVPDQGAFERDLKRIIDGSRRGDNVSVVMVDLDDFKGINDTYGHEKGDEVLKKVAEGFQEIIRDVDEVYRYGGDEFTFVFPDTDQYEAGAVSRRIYDEIMDLDVWDEIDGDEVDFGLSVGMTTYRGNSGSPTDEVYNSVFECADRAMYHSKENEDVKVTFAEYTEKKIRKDNKVGLKEVSRFLNK